MVAWLRASCSSQLQPHISGEGKKKKRREEKRRNVEKRWESRCDRKNGRGWEEIGRRNEIRARHFRPVKPITTTFFARSITRNRVNCKLTRRVEETFENLKRQLDRLSRRSSRRPSDRYAGVQLPRGSYMALPAKNYCFSVYRFSREGRARSSILLDFQPFHVHDSAPLLPSHRGPRNNNFSTATFFEDLNFPRSYFRSKSGRRHRGGASC